MVSVAEQVAEYVKKRPYLQEALENEVVNYSALARKINKELKMSNEAVKAALRRMSRKLSKRRKRVEKEILAVLKKSALEVKGKVAVLISYKKPKVSVIATAKGPSGHTSIMEASERPKLKKSDIIKTEKDLSLISISSPEDIETTPGVIAYLLKVLANENINIYHFISCYKDTLLVVKRKDVPKAFNILSEKLED